MFFTAQTLNNVALGYRISVPLHIIFRSGGLIVGMVLGWAVAGKRYTLRQVVSVILVTLGVVSATLSADIGSKEEVTMTTMEYIVGIILLSVALVISSLMGLFQEVIYEKYGKHWREALFYTHALAMPLFLVFFSDIHYQSDLFNASPLLSLATILSNALGGMSFIIPQGMMVLLEYFRVPRLWVYLALNMLTHYLCVSGVHRLHAHTTSLTLNLVLNLRKFTSLMISVWYFDNSLNLGMAWGSVLVFFGTFLYAWQVPSQKQKAE